MEKKQCKFCRLRKSVNSKVTIFFKSVYNSTLVLPILIAAVFFTPGASASSANRSTSLADLIRFTMHNHPSVRSGEFQINAAEAEVDVAEQAFWPTPSVSLDYNFDSITSKGYDADSVVKTLRLQQPVWTGGRLSSGLERAEAKVDVAASSLSEIQEQLIVELIQAWSDWTATNQKIDAVRSSMDTHLRLIGMVGRRTAEGMSAEADVALAESRIGAIEAELELLNAQRNQAIEKLTSLVGFDVSRMQLLPLSSIPEFYEQTLENLMLSASKRHPSVMSARYQSRVAQAEIKSTKAALYPEISLSFEHQRGNFNTFESRNNNQIYLSITGNFGPGLSNFSRIDGAVAQHQAALEEINARKQSIDERVRSDWTLWLAAQRRLKSLRSATEASASVLVSYERQFLAGRKQWLDLMNAAREQAQSASQAADAYGALVLSSLRLQLLIEGPEALLSKLTQNESYSS